MRYGRKQVRQAIGYACHAVRRVLNCTLEAGPMNTTLIAEIRAEMGRQRMSQTTLAGKLRRRPDWLSRRLTGRVDLTVADVEAIASVLGVPPGRLWRQGETIT